MLIERSVNKLHCWYWVKNFVILESVICCCNVNYLAGATDSLSNCIASCLLMQCWKIMWNHHSAETKSIFTYISMMWLPWWWRGSEEARNAWFWGSQCTHRAPLAGGFPPQHPRGFTMYHPRRGKGPKVALLPVHMVPWVDHFAPKQTGKAPVHGEVGKRRWYSCFLR